jgi:PAS domain S-box-containing protein
VFLSALAAGLVVVGLLEQAGRVERRAAAAVVASSAAATIEQQLSRSLAAVHALAAFVQRDPELPDFGAIADELIAVHGGISSLQLAPGGVLRRIHPLAGNEAALGLDLFADPQRRPWAEATRDSRQLTLDGPFLLRQGGMGVVGRLAVRRPGPDREEFWGFAAALIRLPEFLDAARVQALEEDGYAWTLSYVPPGEGVPVPFARSKASLPADPVQETVVVPNGRWLLQAAPIAGWGSSRLPLGLVLALAVAGLLAALAWPVLQAPLRLQAEVAARTAELTAAQARLEAELAERRRAEEAQRVTAERFAQALRAARGGAWEWDMATGTARLSAETYDLLGLDPGAGMSREAFLATVLPEDREAVDAAVLRTMQAGTDLDHEFRILRRGEVRWVRTVGRISAGPDGKPRSMYGIQLDVTDRHRAEEGLRQAQKMEAIGQLAGGVAHDFNNLLVGILGYADVLEEPDPPVAEAARSIRKAGQRAAELTRQLLGFARGGKYRPEPVDLNDVVREVEQLLSRTLDKGIALGTRLEAQRAVVRGDASQLHQVILNLAVNARDAMPQGGSLTISTRAVEVGPEEARGLPGLAPGPCVAVEVADTGSGIPRAIQGRIFEPFFTTKPAGKGTGMGLATVYGVVRNHGGAVRLESEEGRGSRFTVYLPLIRAAPDAPRAIPAVRHGTGQVLVVDDEPLARTAACRMLRALGYQALEAAGAEEAVALRRSTGVRAALVDLAMPGADGRECLRMLRAEGPGLRAVLASGYGAEGRVQEALAEGFVGFLQKPYGLAELGEAVQKLFGDAPAA